MMNRTGINISNCSFYNYNISIYGYNITESIIQDNSFYNDMNKEKGTIMLVHGVRNNLINRNYMTNSTNSGKGIYLQGTLSISQAVSGSDNIISNNVLNNIGSNGIDLFAKVYNNTIQNNTVNETRMVGIIINRVAINNTILSNRVSFTHEDGIQIRGYDGVS